MFLMISLRVSQAPGDSDLLEVDRAKAQCWFCYRSVGDMARKVPLGRSDSHLTFANLS